jgi:hypothetical protein
MGIRRELFNFKHAKERDPGVKRPKYTAVFNKEQKKYEVMKTSEVLGGEAGAEDDSEDEEDKQQM